jgi:hypothetical protein
MRFPKPTRGLLAWLALLTGLVLGGFSTAGAATLREGTIELTPSLDFSHTSFSFLGSDAGSLTSLTGSGRLGYCLTRRVEVDGELLLDHTSIDPPGSPSVSGTSIGFGGGLTFNFASSGQTIPFLRFGLGILTNSGDLSTGTETTFLAPAIEAGLRVLVGSSSSVNFAARYVHAENALGDPDLDSNTFGVAIGVSVFPNR